MKISTLFKEIEKTLHYLALLGNGQDLPIEEIPLFEKLFIEQGVPLSKQIDMLQKEFLIFENYTAENFNHLISVYSSISDLYNHYYDTRDINSDFWTISFEEATNTEKFACIIHSFKFDVFYKYGDFYESHHEKFPDTDELNTYNKPVLQKTFPANNIQDLITTINNAFFRLECYMKGTISEYRYFGFDSAFTLLFKEAHKYENLTIENSKVINYYWKLAEQIRVDFDKSDFDNHDAYSNPHFCDDCNELSNIAFDRIEEFTDFISQDEIDEYERKDSITDIFKAAPVIQPAPAIKPAFKPEAIETIFDILKDFFSSEHQSQLKQILISGDNASEPLIFLDNGNRLADAFKNLKTGDFITGCEKKEIEAWISKNFKYRYRQQIKDFTPKYLNDIISTTKDKCQNPILNVKLDKPLGKYLITKA